MTLSIKALLPEEPKPEQDDDAKGKGKKQFAKAFANRVWHQLFGYGITNVVDDMAIPEKIGCFDKFLNIFSLDLKCLSFCGASDNPYFLEHSLHLLFFCVFIITWERGFVNPFLDFFYSIHASRTLPFSSLRIQMMFALRFS